MKTILIEKTAKRLKLYELVITALLFITLLTGFGALYIAIPLASGSFGLHQVSSGKIWKSSDFF